MRKYSDHCFLLFIGYTPDVYVAADEVPSARPYPFMVWLNAIRLGISPISAIVKVQTCPASRAIWMSFRWMTLPMVRH